VLGAGRNFTSGSGKNSKPTFPRWADVINPKDKNSEGEITKEAVKEKFRQMKARVEGDY